MPIPRYLVKWLIVPLGLATVVTFLIGANTCEPWSGFLINLAAGFVGTILTVVFVDVVLARHHEDQWRPVRDHAKARLERLANTTATSIRVALRIRRPQFVSELWDRPELLRSAMIDFVREVIHPRLPTIPELDVATWQSLIKDLASVSQSSERLLALFGSHLSAPVSAGLIELQEAIDSAMGLYSVFPDVIGVREADLKPLVDGRSALPTQQAILKNMEHHLSRVLEAAAKLLYALSQ